MKFKSLLMLGFVVFLAVACGGGKDAIQKSWTLEDIVIGDAALEKIPAEQREMAKETMKGMIDGMKGKMNFEFKADGKAVAEAPGFSGDVEKNEGTWKLSDDGKTLTVDIDGKAQDFKVVELSSSKLHIEQEGMGMVFVPKK